MMQYELPNGPCGAVGPGGMAERRGWPGCEVRSDPCLPMGRTHQGHPQGTSHELPHHNRVQGGECREHLLWSSYEFM